MSLRANQPNKNLPYGGALVAIVIGALLAYFYVSHAGGEDAHVLSLINTLLLFITTLSLALVVVILRQTDKEKEDLADMRADFVAVASHELRSPLTAVRWKLSELRADTSLSQDARTMANGLYEQICSLISLTSTFLLMTSVDQGPVTSSEMKPANITPALKEAVVHAQTTALPKKIRVEARGIIDTPIIIKADPARIRIIFDNLLSNAIKYSREGTTITFSYTDLGTNKRFDVHDTGIGVPRDELKKIFTGYHRASNAKRSGALGSGFGLYMVKKIVDLHHGTITCTSEEGGGTTFTVVFPSDG